MNARNLENRISYIHGRLEAQIEGFANALGIPVELLTSRLVELLQPQRERRTNRMSQMSRPTTKERPAAREVEVAHNAPGHKTQVKKKSAQKAYWANKSPEERRAEVKRRMNKAKQNRLENVA